MSKLYMDLGNTSLKVFNEQGELLGAYNKYMDNWEEDFKRIFEHTCYVSCILASVATKAELSKIKSLLPDEISLTEASFNLGLWSVVPCYQDPSKLGIDRLLAMEAAFRESESSVVVIDCGSAVTVDYVSQTGFHEGGYIVPGYRLQMESLLRDTSLSFEDIRPSLGLGQSTSECIRNGSLRMITSLCESVIERYQPSVVVLTGGDLSGDLSSLSQLGRRDDLLVFKGLNYVYKSV